MTAAQEIDRNAALWVERMSSAAPAADDARAFDAWIAQDPEHAESYGRMQALWQSETFVQALGEVAWQAPRPHPARAWLAKVRGFLTQPITLGMGGALATAAVAAIAFAQTITVQDFTQQPGAAREIALADGTHVTLSGGTRLIVRMTPWSRTAKLERGEAYFDVAHEELRKFSIASGDTSIAVLGTAFDVDRSARDVVSVRVYRGLVAVEAADGSGWRLPAGTALRVAGNAGRQLRPPYGNAPAWLDGWYETDDATLQQLVDRLSRFSAKPVRLADPALGAIPVSGRFRIAEPARVLEALAVTHDLRWHETTDGYTLLR